MRLRLSRRRPPVAPAAAAPSIGRPEDIWGPDVPALAEWSTRARRSWIFLHPPKTGGSTFGQTLETTPGWTYVRLTALHRVDTPCPCGTGCRNAPRPEPLAAGGFEPASSLLLGVGHSTYGQVAWLANELRHQGGRVDVTVTTVRPIRNRLTSMFRDYWTQVRLAAEHESGVNPASAHRAIVLRGYAADSAHYLRSDGTIDGRAWFSAFAEHGAGGVPFFLSDFFGDAQQARQAVATGALTLVPTASIDATLAELTGEIPTRRARVSSPAHSAAVDAALDDAADLIDELAQRDRAFAWMTDPSPSS